MALQVGHRLIPSPTVKTREWSTVNGTLAGYFPELRLFSESLYLLAIGVAFMGGMVVKIVRELAAVLG